MLDSLFRTCDHILVLDLETTGFDSRREEIIELGVFRLDKDAAIPASDRELNLLVKLSPGRRLPPVITNLTGITENLLIDQGIEKASACDQLSRWLDCPRPLLAAYNAQFDLGFLYSFLDRFGKANLLDRVTLLDALTIYKDRRPYPHTLKDAVSAYALQTQNTHRAIDDAKVTFELLCAMEREFNDLDRYVNLFGYNPKYGISGRKFASVRYLPQPYNMTRKLYEL